MGFANRSRRRSLALIALAMLTAGVLVWLSRPMPSRSWGEPARRSRLGSVFGMRQTNCADVSCLAPEATGEAGERCSRPNCVRQRFAWAHARVVSLHLSRSSNLDVTFTSEGVDLRLKRGFWNRPTLIEAVLTDGKATVVIAPGAHAARVGREIEAHLDTLTANAGWRATLKGLAADLKSPRLHPPKPVRI